METIEINAQSLTPDKIPCVLRDTKGQVLGMLVNVERFRQLATDDVLGTCSSHMAALLQTMTTRAERRERMERLSRANRNKGLEEVRELQAESNEMQREKSHRKPSRLKSGRRRARPI